MLRFYEFFFPVVWIAFLVYWQIIWARTANRKTVQRLEPAASRILRAFTFLIVIALFMVPRIPLRWLYFQLWALGLWAFWIGAAVTVSGLLFAVWARLHLGSNWSRAVTIKQDHELITTGPYALVRHPIYTVILIGFLGSAIALSQVRGLVALGLVFLVFWAKFRMEEKWMHSQFGEMYSDYSQKTAALVPFLF
jgi:protein-S-isoprenylcysteine O-methyltransferase Ste14